MKGQNNKLSSSQYRFDLFTRLWVWASKTILVSHVAPWKNVLPTYLSFILKFQMSNKNNIKQRHPPPTHTHTSTLETITKPLLGYEKQQQPTSTNVLFHTTCSVCVPCTLILRTNKYTPKLLQDWQWILHKF